MQIGRYPASGRYVVLNDRDGPSHDSPSFAAALVSAFSLGDLLQDQLIDRQISHRSL
jgi:hypothetical protein